jgi:hypothetical protein
MATGNTNRIGIGTNQQSPIMTTVNQPAQPTDEFTANVLKAFESRGIKLDTNLGTGPSVDLLSSFDKAEWAAIGRMLQKLGSRVQGVQEAKFALQTTYGSILSTATSFAEVYRELQSDYIPGLDTEAYKGPETRVQLQDPMVIDSLIRGVYQSTLKRDPNSDELAARRVEIDEVIKKGTTTTPIGQAKAISTPGFTQAGAEEMIKSKIESGDTGVQEDLAQAQSLEFANFIGKLGK